MYGVEVTFSGMTSSEFHNNLQIGSEVIEDTGGKTE
jgi:hypothetical protein